MFSRVRIAVYVDGCFWHRCPTHGTAPSTNARWWERKLNYNVRRDERATAALNEAGWRVVRIWEHENPEAAADLIAGVVLSARAERSDR